jgi:hypothetical protein
MNIQAEPVAPGPPKKKLTSYEISSHDQRNRWNSSSAVQEKAHENDSNKATHLHHQHHLVLKG